ncbi:A24 family peptidase [Allobranchiibius sp. GilTou38]|uniref:prepilin peptidase n=1 Tax=Allobranchiibius sp. GilTou38 TaxID=2815210 RepID=UPI001AA0BE17|nr:A24 family peptidase [Allobranchiibius sp. GilTou38]MBO1766984.1 prepilin peptidase [Allobranchiibius sp. GilTou38]
MIAAAVLLAGAVGAAYGEWLRRSLATGRYRLPEESAPLPARRWLVPVAALAAAGAVWHLADLHRWGLVSAYVVLIAVALPLAAIDLDVHRLPDRLTLPAIPVIALLLALDWDVHRLPRALLCGALAGTVFLLLALAVPGGLGLGDVKLAALLGLPLGWWGYPVLIQGLAGGFVIGGLVSLVLVLTRRATRHTHVALGPSLLLGALGALLAAT